MRWDAPTVAHLAAGAGFGRPDLHTATAIAMAATNGIDHYDVSAGAPGTGRWVGLWALDVDEWTDYRADWLLTPENAARAAYDLTQRCDGFGWSACWRAGREAHWLDAAAAAHTLHPYQETDRRPIYAHVAQRQLDAIGARLGRHVRYG